ncbi:MAG: apolipoprotein N-acyltransferase, partial [Pseudomonadota bacterium]
FLTGFPWVFLGYGYIDTPLAGFAPIGGVFLLSFMACAITCTFATGLIRKSKPLIGVSLGLALTSAIAGHTLSSVEWTAPRGETRTVAIVQPNTPQELKWNPRYYQQILSNLERLNAQAASGDIIIWPEAAVPRYLHNAEADLESIKNRAGELNQALITGIPFANRALKQSHNSITVLSGGEGLYHKQRLVPFGEYVPLEFALRGLIDFFDLPMSSFSKGKPFQSPLWAQGQIISPSICYEVVYPDFVARNARASDWLLTISNDSWFGDSIGPIQHLQMAQMRALETQRYLVRGTSNGISAIINERGAIQAQTEQFVATVLRGEVESRTGSTPFMQAGSTPIIVLSLIALLYARRRNPTSAN